LFDRSRARAIVANWRRGPANRLREGLANAFAGTDLQAQLATTDRKNVILAG